jgi:alkanesulfonate monooxygenase SsuD/methylene tetrahydromethanopterin reductase-like flavin-dependent oxidoreductase (luciferase family)
MRFGIFIPPFGPCADVATLASLASEAEEAGWDGFFLWDDVTINIPIPVADPWVALSAITLRTRTLRLGALVTPLPRRRPWKVARETVTLDHLSQGRLIVGVGLGGDPAEFDDLGEEADLKVRAAMLGEGLDILTGLWSGEPFQYEGGPLPYPQRAVSATPIPVASHSCVDGRDVARQSPFSAGRRLRWCLSAGA